MKQPPRSCFLPLLCAACVLFLSRSTCLCQMAQPFTGMGVPPEESVQVFVTALMERMLDVDEKDYRFENIVYIYFSWNDSRAYTAMLESTEAIMNNTKDECGVPCGGTAKQLTQATAGVTMFCCDNVWLPQVDIMNVYELPEGRMQTSGILVTPGQVAWYVAIHGTYFSPMDFKRFPFDTQELVMQLRAPSANVNIMPVSAFIPSATSTRWLIEGSGDIVSGWDVKSLQVRPFRTNLQRQLDYFVGTFGTPSNPNDPLPVALTSDENAFMNLEDVANEGALFENETIVGFDIVIKVDRFWQYFIINMFVPILLLAVLSFITYAIPAQYLDARVALNVTLFLSLTALQFVINDQLPKSSYPTTVTQLIVICYVIVALAIPESLVVYTLSEQEAEAKATAEKPVGGSSGEGPAREDETAVAEPDVKRQQSRIGLLSKRMLTMRREEPMRLAKMIDRGMMITMAIVVVVATAVICAL